MARSMQANQAVGGCGFLIAVLMMVGAIGLVSQSIASFLLGFALVLTVVFWPRKGRIRG